MNVTKDLLTKIMIGTYILSCAIIIGTCGWLALLGIFLFITANNYEQLSNHIEKYHKKLEDYLNQ